MNGLRSIIIYANYGKIKYNLADIIKTSSLKQTGIAKRTGLSDNVVKRYINNSVKKVDKDVLAKLCYVLNCDISHIMTYEKESQKYNSNYKDNKLYITDSTDYGHINLNIKSILNKYGYGTKTKDLEFLKSISGLDETTIINYVDNKIIRIDLDILAKFCYILNCDATDIITYVKPK